jgi:hypothetical protein
MLMLASLSSYLAPGGPIGTWWTNNKRLWDVLMTNKIAGKETSLLGQGGQATRLLEKGCSSFVSQTCLQIVKYHIDTEHHRLMIEQVIS